MPEQTQEKCSKRVYTDGSVFSTSCKRRGIIKEDGCYWCKQHAPSSVKKNSEEWREKFDNKSKAQSTFWAAESRHREAVNAVLKAAKELVNSADKEAVTKKIEEAVVVLTKAEEWLDRAKKAYDEARGKK